MLRTQRQTTITVNVTGDGTNYTAVDGSGAARGRRRRDVVIKSESVRDASGKTLKVVTLVSISNTLYNRFIQVDQSFSRRGKVLVP